MFLQLSSEQQSTLIGYNQSIMPKVTYSIKNLKKATPKWLSVTRNLYVVLGGGALLAFYGIFDFPDAIVVTIDKWYMFVGLLIQVACKVGGYEITDPVDSDAIEDVVQP
jgi:hypothetical protein